MSPTLPHPPTEVSPWERSEAAPANRARASAWRMRLGRRLLPERARQRLREVTSPIALQHRLLGLSFRMAGLREERVALPNGVVRTWASRDTRKKPLLLLHGFGGNATIQWAGQVRELSRVRRIIAPDLLYFGESRSHRAEYGFEYQVETVMQLLDRMGIDHVDVLGISYGGLVAYELAWRHPERVDRIILSNSPGPVLEHRDHAAMLDRLGVRQMSDFLVPERPENVRELMAVAWHRPPYVPGFALRDAHQQLFADQANEKTEVMRDLTSRIARPEYASYTLPHETMIIWGEHDRVFPMEIAHRLRRNLGARARLFVIPDTAHAPNQEKPEEFNRIVLDFLRRGEA